MAQVIQNICDQFLQVYTIYYMDDILLSHKNEGVLLAIYGQLQQSFANAGLIITPEKVQRQPLFHYLGHILYPKEIKLRKLEIRKKTYKL